MHKCSYNQTSKHPDGRISNSDWFVNSFKTELKIISNKKVLLHENARGLPPAAYPVHGMSYTRVGGLRGGVGIGAGTVAGGTMARGMGGMGLVG